MNIDCFITKKWGFLILLVLVQFMLVMPEWAFAADSGWNDVTDPDDWEPYKRMNVFIQSSNIYVKIGVAVVSSVLLYYVFLFLFVVLIKQNNPPCKCFSVTFSLYLISMYLVAFICFSEYTVINQYAEDISLRDYFSELNIKLLVFSFVGWGVISMILSTALSSDTANNS